MPVKSYGVFFSFPPGAELSGEGLGRYLLAFVQAARERENVRLVVVVPSWTRASISTLLKEIGNAKKNDVELSGPRSQPVIYRIYKLFHRRPRLPGRNLRLHYASDSPVDQARLYARLVLGRMAASRTPLGLVLWMIATLVLAIVAIPLGLVFMALVQLRRLVRQRERLAEVFQRRYGDPLRPLRGKVRAPYRRLIAALLAGMQRREAELMLKHANSRTDVVAWYAPTAFWAEVLRLKKPQLICVPDVVPSEFPAGFAALPGSRILEEFRQIERVLNEAQNLAVYSERVKNQVLMSRFKVPADRISVIPHAPISLERHVAVDGKAGAEQASRNYGQTLFALSLEKANTTYVHAFNGTTFQYILFPSQFRPSKNVLTLVKAFRYLLQERLFGKKLLLTGHPYQYPGLADYVSQHNLVFEVLFLKDLSEAELAGCYKLADLAVNPSLSEGGMPFTFSEALSVGTPVVMSDIEVTREVITDPDLREATLFDPYDWRAMADKIEWALNNRTSLYAQQRKFYDEVLSKRTWDHVVGEHLKILDDISDREPRPREPRPVQRDPMGRPVKLDP